MVVSFHPGNLLFLLNWLDLILELILKLKRENVTDLDILEQNE